MQSKAKLAAPPIIILMDVLAQYLFVSMVQQTPGIEVMIPQDQLFKGAKIIYKLDGEVKYFNGSNFVQLDKGFGGGFYLKRSCVGTICDKARKSLPIGVEPEVAITGKLFSNLSTLSFLACNTSASQCSNIRYDILQNGTIDKEALLKYNPVFSKIDGLEAF
jgi:hypothetical protein